MTRYSQYGRLDSPIQTVFDRRFSRFNDRFRADQLDEGTLAFSGNGRMEINDEWRVRPGIGVVANPIASGPLSMTVPFFLYEQQEGPVSFADNVLRVTVQKDLFSKNISNDLHNAGYVHIGKVDGILYPSPIGNQYISEIEHTDEGHVLVIPLAQLAETSGEVSGTTTVSMPIMEERLVSTLQGSAAFSDPNEKTSSYIVLAGSLDAYYQSLSDTENHGFIYYPKYEPELLGSQKQFLVGAEDGDSLATERPRLLGGEGQTQRVHKTIELTEPVDVLQAFNQVFIFRDGKTALVWDGDFAKPFQFVERGSASQPRILDDEDNTSISNGLVTVAQDNHGLKVGGKVVVVNAGSSPLKAGDEYEVALVPDPDTFAFYATVDDTTEAITVAYSQPQSQGIGFIHMPAPRFAVYHGRRLWMPFEYLPKTVDGEPVIEPRRDENGNRITDALIASDILDPNRYDQLSNQFRVNAGRADYIVGMLSFTDDTLLVFNRNSVHSITNTLNLEEASVELLTGEVGCCARRSIVQVGSTIFFLSDNGVYGLSYRDFITLRGDTLPLSEPIQSTISRINKEAQHKAIGVYYENRIYFALPLDGSTGNNAIVIFNFLNKGWESVDTFDLSSVGTNEFHIEDMFVAGDGESRGVYITNQDGALHRMDSHDDGMDRLISFRGQEDPIAYPIQGVARTRMYGFGPTQRVKWMSYDLHLQGGDQKACDISVKSIVENLDGETVYEISNTAEEQELIPAREDVSIRRRIGNRRGTGYQMEIRNTAGAPRLRAVRVSGIITFRSQMDAY